MGFRSMFVILVFGRAFAKRKDVKGRGPEPMNAIDNGEALDIGDVRVEEGEGCCEIAARMFDNSRLTRST